MTLKTSLAAAMIAASAMAAPAYAGVSISVEIGVPLAPPVAVYERVPPPPAVGYIWAPGYWAWFGNRYIWVHGRYIHGRPGYVWHPEHWQRRGNRWHFVRGEWGRERHPRHATHGHHDRDRR